MKETILRDILAEKKTKVITANYTKLNLEDFADFRIPEVTIHGRFQPPLHINHFYLYVATAFRIAKKVQILITNPNLDESDVNESTHRNKKENNPFTYEERVEIFEKFFENFGIPNSRYEFKPFDITAEDNWLNILDKNIPNLINTYGKWSEAKLSKFQTKGCKVIHSNFPKLINISGTDIRKILFSDLDEDQKKEKLINAGLMPEAVEPVLKILKK